MTPRFELRKKTLLQQINAPDSEYQDLSPKGCIDAPIRTLIDEINRLEGLITTSSCSGRISVFCEGRKTESKNRTADDVETRDSRAGPGGKGGGGAWLFISHDPIEEAADTTKSLDWMSVFGLQLSPNHQGLPKNASLCRYIHLKFEPMILHVLTASPEIAHKILTAGLGAGFRESGAVSLGSTRASEANPMVAIRSTGYAFDSIIGYQDDNGCNIAMVDEAYLHTLVMIANERFVVNKERIARFRTALVAAFPPSASEMKGSSSLNWEDADERKRRKREEGLARQHMLQMQRLPRIEDTNVSMPCTMLEE